MEELIRPATIDDHAGIARVAAETADLHARALPERFREAADPLPEEYLRAIADHPGRQVLVAERAGHMAGYVIVGIRATYPYPVVVPRRFAVIDEVAVASVDRRRGIGRRLVDAAIAWAGERSATSIELNVYEFNELAIAFYEELGFRAIKRTMTLPVEHT